MSINQSAAGINRSVAEVLDRHVVLTVESLDRIVLSAIVPRLQIEKNVAAFFLRHRQVFFVKELARMTRDFGTRVERFAEAESVPLITFETKAKQRKEDVAAEHRRQNPIRDGVLFIGKAQEKAFVPRVTKTQSHTTGNTIPWLAKRTAMVNHYYFYCIDDDFGPFFIKYCSYFPDNARLCLNGHESCKGLCIFYFREWFRRRVRGHIRSRKLLRMSPVLELSFT